MRLLSVTGLHTRTGPESFHCRASPDWAAEETNNYGECLNVSKAAIRRKPTFTRHSPELGIVTKRVGGQVLDAQLEAFEESWLTWETAPTATDDMRWSCSFALPPRNLTTETPVIMLPLNLRVKDRARVRDIKVEI